MDPWPGFCLAGVAGLSLVLPLTAGAGLAAASRRASAVRTVWAGVCLTALGGLWIALVPSHPVVGLVVAGVASLGFLPRLRRQLRPA